MTVRRERMATLGLLCITIWSAVQYILFQNITESVSTFSFMFITNVVGFLILGAAQIKKLHLITRKTWKKAMILALELVGFNVFLIIGSQGVDPVIASSLSSMDFLFILPILILLKKRVSFRSAVASIVAMIALLLMFDADFKLFFTSANVLFLFVSDFFFAIYVISISMLGEEEDASAITIAQMACSIIFSFVGWGVEVAIGVTSFSFPANTAFWITVLFFGVFIRALYGLIQVACQKYVKPINASLIFSSEIIITLIASPWISKLMHTTYTKATLFQVIGCFLFVIAVLVADDTVMERLGYNDMETKKYVDENGVEKTQTTVSRKLTNITLILCMSALVVATVICLSSISSIKKTSVEESMELGYSAAAASETALRGELEKELVGKVNDKAAIAEEKLRAYISAAEYAADTASSLYNHSSDFQPKEVLPTSWEHAGELAMQRVLAEGVDYENLKEECCLLGNMEDIFDTIVNHTENIATIYIGTETGLLISYDRDSTMEDYGEEYYYEYREADWYKDGKTAKEVFFTKAYQDQYDRGLIITCSAPVYDASGQFRGCIGIDILMNDINQSMVNDNIVDPNYATMIDSEGYIIASKDVDGNASGTLSIYDGSVNSVLSLLPPEVLLSTEDGIEQVGEGDQATYISFASIPLTQWKICIMSPVANIIKPASDMRESITRNTEIVADMVDKNIRKVINGCLTIFALIILIVTYFAGRLAGMISRPLEQLEKDVAEISRGNLGRRTLVSTDDEIGSLARAFNFMTESLQKYISNIKDMTVKEERIASELSLATKIQEDMLPRVFDLGRNEFELYADMTPAKEVGGDFYDFFLIDEDHLALVMADVSGKGVPAALFMMRSKTLIKNTAQTGFSPAQVFEKVNEQLCENNEAELFVTAWLGVLELSTGKMTCVNAGHEYPAIRRAGGSFELLMDKHGFVLGGMEGVRYKEYQIELCAGDEIFVYTDGVAEATDGQNVLFGTERMVQALNQEGIDGCISLLSAVHSAVNQFVGEAPQFDDITMLSLRYDGNHSN